MIKRTRRTKPATFSPTFVKTGESYKGYLTKLDQRSPDMRMTAEQVASEYPDIIVPSNLGEEFFFQLRHHIGIGYVISLTQHGMGGFWVVGEILTDSITPTGRVKFVGAAFTGNPHNMNVRYVSFQSSAPRATCDLEIFEKFRALFHKKSTIGRVPRKKKAKPVTKSKSNVIQFNPEKSFEVQLAEFRALPSVNDKLDYLFTEQYTTKQRMSAQERFSKSTHEAQLALAEIVIAKKAA